MEATMHCQRGPISCLEACTRLIHKKIILMYYNCFPGAFLNNTKDRFCVNPVYQQHMAG